MVDHASFRLVSEEGGFEGASVVGIEAGTFVDWGLPSVVPVMGVEREEYLIYLAIWLASIEGGAKGRLGNKLARQLD